MTGSVRGTEGIKLLPGTKTERRHVVFGLDGIIEIGRSVCLGVGETGAVKLGETGAED
jgi:hypothetical protein